MKSFYYFLALVIPIILASCNNRGEINADTIEKILDTVSNTFINKPEHYGFGLYRDTSIRIADGIEVEFNSKSLLAIGGIKPYSGLVDMSFIVVDQLNEFLKEFKSTTTSRGELMKTKGYLRIELRDSGGKKLFVDQLYPLKLKIHKKYELDAYHWYQSDSCGYGWGMPQNFTKVYNTDTLQDLNFMVSTEAESDTVKAYNLMGHRVTGGDVISYYVGMKYVDVWFGINILWNDHYIKDVHFECQLMNMPINIKNVRIALMFPKDHCFLTGKHSFASIFRLDRNQNGMQKLPLGHEATLIVYGFENNKAYFFQNKFIVKSSNLLKATLRPVTIDEIEQKLQNL